jgi:hypothetical protein
MRLSTLLPFTFLLAVSASSARQRVDANSVQLRIIDGYTVADGVFVNGSGPYRFLIDTGARSNLIYSGLASRLGWIPAYRVSDQTVFGDSSAGACIAAISLGPASAENQEMILAALDGQRRVSPEIQGVLGQEFLRHFDYMLDFDRGILTFGAPQPAGAKANVEFVGGMMFAATSAGRLELDSGAGAVILFREKSVEPAGWSTLGATNDSAAVSVGTLRSLDIGDRKLRQVRVALVPAKAIAADRPDGLLPASLFRSVYVSNSEKFVVLGQAAYSPSN